MNDFDDEARRVMAGAIESLPYRPPTIAEIERSLKGLALSCRDRDLERRYRGFIRASAAAFAACVLSAALLGATDTNAGAAIAHALPDNPAGALYACLDALRP